MVRVGFTSEGPKMAPRQRFALIAALIFVARILPRLLSVAHLILYRHRLMPYDLGPAAGRHL